MEQTEIIGFHLIGVAAEILEMHPQTLRKYETAGFVAPRRMGTLRLYSDEDMERLKLVKHFVEDLGLNLSGVQLALNLTAGLLKLRSMSQENEERLDEDVIASVDELLGQMGLRVGNQPARQEPRALPDPGTPAFELAPGQGLRFVVTRSAQDRG